VARQGGDPVVERDRHKRTSLTFEAAARKVHAAHIKPTMKNARAEAQWIRALEVHAFPLIGAKPLHAVEQADVLRLLAPIWLTVPTTAKRIKQWVGVILDWARTAGHREGVNRWRGSRRACPSRKPNPEHHRALPWRDLPALMARLEGVKPMAALALRFAILTAAERRDAGSALERI